MALIIIGGILLFLSKAAHAATPTHPSLQQQQISGTVKDQEGVPIPGVNVIVSGSSTGTMSNLDGEYSIYASVGDTLVYSYIGFKTFIVQVTETFSGDITLHAAVDALDEVIINAGYYNTTKRERTGNISRVTAEEIELQPVTSPLQALQGRMAGVEVIPNGNIPGSASTIRIRGTNSLREEGNFPLYIIDGVPINSIPVDSNSNLTFNGGIDPLNTLNLSNIESIEILKDADATAIYGSRGANGVVLITTKKGISARNNIQIRAYTGYSEVPNRVDLLGTEEYLNVRRRAFENDDVEPTVGNAYDLLVWDANRYTDWQDVFFGGTSEVTDVTLSSSGGNKQTTFRLSGGYHAQGSVFIGDYNYRKISAGAQISHKTLNDKLSLNLSLNYGIDKNDLVGYLNMTTYAFELPPNAPSIFNPDGTLNWEDWQESSWSNPYEGFFNKSNTEVKNLITNLSLDYEIFNGLNLKTNLGYTNYDGDELVKRPQRSYNPENWDNIENRSGHLQNNRNSWIFEPQLIFNSEFLKGELSILLGATFQERTTRQISLYGEGYVTESLIGNLNAAENIRSVSYFNSEYRYNAVFGRIGYQWDNKYLLNLTGRRDGSSRFGANNRFANFGAIGAAWIFSEEAFMKKLFPVISFWKFRGSYGTTGNDQIGDYGYLDAYEATPGPGGLYPTQLSNPNFSWETNKKFEIATELSIFKNRIDLGISWYRNRSSDQLVGYPLPAITGFNSVQANLPATVENRGLEIELSTLNIQSKKFNWTTSLNISFPRNELVSYPGLEESSYANTYRVGEPLNIALLYSYQGMDPTTGEYTFVDVNEDGRYDYEDRQYAWDRGRQFFGGITNQIEYKQFSFQFLVDFVKQEGTLGLFNTGFIGNQRADVLDNDTDYQNISQSTSSRTAYNNVLNSNFPIVDASFLRLKTASLTYKLPNTLIQEIGFTSANIFINGQNLYTFTDYKGLDPESPYLGTGFTQLRSVTGGIQLNF
ncbi:SusC/RagA family TonB-linked outer membrane protein [Zunongwangia atlantica]|nr:SusC/RagA family TonB-linked outer membrane protein [Zunongwangia atlantica]